MKKIAIVFPGQGSQKVGMGQDFSTYSESSKALLKQGFSQLGDGYQKICFEGPQETLTQTQHAQPLIFLVSAVIFNTLKEKGITPNYVAGHSLGELTAYYASGALSLEDTLTLIKKRGSLMAAAHPPEDSAMCAVIGSDETNIQSAVKQAETQPVVAANFNCPSQIVISGKKEGVSQAKKTLQENGAKCIDLPVSGAFHSPLMTQASDQLSAFTQDLSLNSPSCPIILNRVAEPESNVSNLQENIGLQVKSPVKWTQTIQYLEASGVDTIIECGPGRVLSGLIKKTTSTITPININSVDALTTFLDNN